MRELDKYQDYEDYEYKGIKNIDDLFRIMSIKITINQN